MPSFSEWQQQAQTLSISTQAIINGKACDAVSGNTFDCFSPIDGRLLGQVAACGAEDVELTVSAARNAFESGCWAELKLVDRKSILLKFAALIDQHGDELALEAGIPAGVFNVLPGFGVEVGIHFATYNRRRRIGVHRFNCNM